MSAPAYGSGGPQPSDGLSDKKAEWAGIFADVLVGRHSAFGIVA